MNLNFKSFLLTPIAFICLQPAMAQQSSVNPAAQLKISGYVGERINDCITHRVKGQDVDHLIEPFRNRVEKGRWQMEFWGKWVQGAIASYRYNHDPELYEIIKKSAEDIMSTQTEDGYIGNYPPQYQLNTWDVWGRKYTTLGLLSWYDLSKDKKALQSACRVIDHLMSQVGPGKRDIATTGLYFGMASCSVLEPVLYLYKKTNEQKYLDFANHFVSLMSVSLREPCFWMRKTVSYWLVIDSFRN